MESKKAVPTYSPDIYVVGDSIIDKYDSHLLPGGALNVYYNISMFTDFLKLYAPSEKSLIYTYPNYKSKYNCYKPLSNKIFAQTLVCSDYSKGFLQNIKAKISCYLLIVDSKYATLDLAFLKNAKIKILKQTSTDVFNLNFIKHFDYLIITDHNKNVTCYDRAFNLIYTATPPDIKAINSSGAGDVFVAVLSYYLHDLFDNQNLSVLFEAIDKAVYWASLSTTTPYTSNIKDINVHY